MENNYNNYNNYNDYNDYDNYYNNYVNNGNSNGNNNNNDNLLGAWLFLAIGIGILIHIGWTVVSLLGRTEAYRIEWTEGFDEDGNFGYSPIYYFESGNKVYTCTSELYGSKDRGKGIVYYDLSDPEDCMTDFERSFDEFYWVIYLFLLLPIIIELPVGLFFLFLGYGPIKNMKKKSLY